MIIIREQNSEELQPLKDGLIKRMPSRGCYDVSECLGESQSRDVLEARSGESDRMGGAECQMTQD